MPISEVSTQLRAALADELKRLRGKRGFSQETLANLCDLHRTYISLLERGLKSPTVDALGRIAKALDEKPSRLLARAERRLGGKRP